MRLNAGTSSFIVTSCFLTVISCVAVFFYSKMLKGTYCDAPVAAMDDAIGSEYFKYSVLTTIAMCYPAVIELLNDIFVSPVKLWSQNTVLIFSVPLLQLVTNVVFYYYVIPDGRYATLAMVLNVRKVISGALSLLCYLQNDGSLSENILSIILATLYNMGTLAESLSDANLSIYSVFLFKFSKSALGIASLGHIGMFLTWIISSPHKNLSTISKSENSVVKAIHVYSSLMIIIGILLMQWNFNFPAKFNFSGLYLANYNCMLSVYSVTICFLSRDAYIFQVLM